MNIYKLLLSFFLLTACVSKPLEKETLKELKQIHVANTLPEAVAIHFIGTTIFQNNINLVKLQSWDSEKYLLTEFKKQLKNKKVQLAPFNFNREKARKALEKESKGIGGFLAGHFPNEYEPETIIEEAKIKGIKNLLLLIPISGGDNYPLHAPGYGVYCKSAFGIKRDAEAYSLYSVELWDIQEKKKLFHTYFTPNTSNIKFSYNCGELEKKDLTDVAKIGLPYVKQSFTKTVTITLQEMGYLPKSNKK